MRILYFTRADSVHDQRFLAALAESGHEGFVLRLKPGDYPTPSGVSIVEWEGFEEGLQSWNLPLAQRAFQKVIDQVQPDLVHAGPLQDLAFLAAKTNFPKLLAMSWGFDLMKDVHVSKLDEHRARFALQHARGLITDAYSSAEVAISFGYPSERISIFPWGVDLEHFSPEKARTTGVPWREKMGWQNNHVFLCLRSWEPNYGVDVLLRAFAQAAIRDESMRLILLGDGSLQEQILELISVEHLKEKVYLGGRVPNQDLITYYGAADVYVTPSHVDGSSVSLMEALACGLPTIASDIPANLEWVQPGRNGWIFPDDQIEALAQTLQDSHKGNLAEMSIQARQIANRKADWNKNKEVLFATWQKMTS